MIIKEVLILSLKRRMDRRCAMLGHLTTKLVDVPLDHIRFFPANDGAGYESVEDVVASAAEDGFPQYEKIVKDNPYFAAQSRIATDWSWCQAMRYIAHAPEADGMHEDTSIAPTLFLFDDMRLNYNFYMLECVIQMVMERPGPFHALQLHCYRWPWDPEQENYWMDGFLQEGFGGRGDYGLVLTPEGAQRLLDFHFEEPFDTVNNDLAILSKPGERNIGFYSVRQNIVDVSEWDFENDREPSDEKITYDWMRYFEDEK